MTAAAAVAAARSERGKGSTRLGAARGLAAPHATSGASGMAGAPTGEAVGVGAAQTAPEMGAGAGVPAGAGASAGAAASAEAANVAAAGCRWGPGKADTAHGEDRSRIHMAEGRAGTAVLRAVVRGVRRRQGAEVRPLDLGCCR